MKLKTLLLTFLVLISTTSIYSQFDKPSFQVGIGISQPFDELKGGNLYYYGTYGNFPITLIDSSFFRDHYGAKTGINIFGSAKINFDKYDITRGIITLSYNTFNVFESDESGTVPFMTQSGALLQTVTYDYSFSNFTIGIGLEVAPLSFTNVVSPFFNTTFNFNFLSAHLTRTESVYDSIKAYFGPELRLGIGFNAGIEARVSKQIGVVLGVKYDMANLLLKSDGRGFNERAIFGKEGIPLNDKGGPYWSNLPYFAGDYPGEFTGKQKKINFGTIYLAVTFYPKMGL
jgi:hypothetical protein